MGRRVNDTREIIEQRSVSFNRRQIDFFIEHLDFDKNIFCRKAIDDQIALIDPTFLNKEDSRHEA